MNYLLGIDIGSYSTKAVLVDASNGHICAMHQIYHGIHSPKAGFYEQNPESVWWHDTQVVIDFFLKKNSDTATPKCTADEIIGIAVSAIAPCVCFVDEAGQSLQNAILYGIDSRATDEIIDFENNFAHYSEITGNKLSTQSAGPKILWMKKHHPDHYQRAHKIITASSYIVYHLTGEFVQDYYTASFYDPFFDLQQKKWSCYAEQLIDVDKLPKLKDITDIAGYVTKKSAQLTGLKVGTPVIVGTADAYSEGVSCGFGKLGDAFLMLGSSNFFLLQSSVCPAPSSFWSAVNLGGHDYILAGGMATSGSFIEWIREIIYQPYHLEQHNKNSDLNTTDFYDTMNQRVQHLKPGGSHLLILPYFLGERTPIHDSNAKGLIIGLSLNTTKDDIYHAGLEAIAFGIRHNLQQALSLPCRSILVAGGGARNQLFLQILADVCQIKISYSLNNIGACYGNAFLASVAIGLNTQEDIDHWIELVEIKPNPENKISYDQRFQLYLALYQNNKKLMSQL